jgi:hypothetical protein
MAQLITVWWRDIPAQVIGKAGRQQAKVPLSPRFMVAIDRAAMRAGKGSSEDYLADWRRTTQPCEGDVQAATEALAAQLENTYSDDDLVALAKRKGVAEDPDRETHS